MTYREQIAGLGMLLVELRRENDALKLRLAAQDRGHTTIEAEPPDDLLDRITPRGCPHRRVSVRPDLHGNPVATCLDCDVELET
jgi:hypothetical protein